MHPYFVYMWFVSWLFGVIIVSVIPIAIRYYIYYSNFMTFDDAVIQSLDIAAMGLAFNWTNVTETTVIFTKEKEKIKYKTLLGTILLFSVLTIIGLTLIIHDINDNDIIKEFEETVYNVHMKPFSIILTIWSLLMNIVTTIIIKVLNNE